MTIAISNVVITTDSFENWVDKTNQLADAFTTRALTVEANSTGAVTTGNAYCNGVFSANVIAIKTELRGGSVAVSANLYLTSNLSHTGANLHSTANVLISSSNVYVTAANVDIRGGYLQVSSNVNVTEANLVALSPNVVSIGANSLLVTSNTQFQAAKFNVIAANTDITGGLLRSTSNLQVTALTTLAGNVSMTGDLQVISGNVQFDTQTLFVDSVNNRVGVGTVTPSTDFTVAGNVAVSSAVTILGNTFVSGNLTFTGTNHTVAGNINFDTGTVFIDSVNNRFGINTTIPDTHLQVAGSANVTSNLAVLGLTTLNNTNVGGTTFNITSNTSGSGVFTWTNSNIALKSNSSVTALAVSANSSATNTTIQGTNLVVTTAAIVATADNLTFTGNTNVKGNTSINSITITGNSTTTYVGVQVTNTAVSSNLTLVGTIHNVTGNVNVAANTLFVDQVSGRVGFKTGAPDATLAVVGTANVSGAVRFGGAVTFASNSASVIAANTLTVTGQFLNVSTIGYFANLSTNTVATFTSNTHLNGTWVNSTANVIIANANTYANVTAATITGGTLTLGSNTTVSGTLDINNRLTVKTDYDIDVISNTNIGGPAGTLVGVYSFDKTTRTSAKLFIQVTNGTSRQFTEALVVHDGTTANFVAYGTVGAPLANTLLATFTAVVSAGNIVLQANQTVANSAVKVVAHFIK